MLCSFALFVLSHGLISPEKPNCQTQLSTCHEDSLKRPPPPTEKTKTNKKQLHVHFHHKSYMCSRLHCTCSCTVHVVSEVRSQGCY